MINTCDVHFVNSRRVCCTCISMCLGLSMYFSISNLSSPKLDAASWDENRKPSLQQSQTQLRTCKMSNRNSKGMIVKNRNQKYPFSSRMHFIRYSAEYNSHNKLHWQTLCKPRKTYLVSSSFQAIRIPFPPPPADALIITGYPADKTLQIKPTLFLSNSLVVPYLFQTLE